ncbi:hypothetical protein ACFQX6_09420 [Streptosporangium lutulentum]
MGVPRTRSGNFSSGWRVAPFVPPLRPSTSSPSTTIEGSSSIRRAMTSLTTSMKRRSASSPPKVDSSS